MLKRHSALHRACLIMTHTSKSLWFTLATVSEVVVENPFNIIVQSNRQSLQYIYLCNVAMPIDIIYQSDMRGLLPPLNSGVSSFWWGQWWSAKVIQQGWYFPKVFLMEVPDGAQRHNRSVIILWPLVPLVTKTLYGHRKHQEAMPGRRYNIKETKPDVHIVHIPLLLH